jgi:hypothetical protein
LNRGHSVCPISWTKVPRARRTDRASFSAWGASYGLVTAGVKVAVDLEPGDGRAGDDDRIRRDVESVFGSQFSDVLVGSDRTTQLLGLDGDDVITGGIAAELLSGGWGNDRIDARDGAADSVDCGGQALDRAAVDLGAEASVTRCAEVVG